MNGASKIADALDSFNANQINHVLSGSKTSNHKWELLSPNKDWYTVKGIIKDVYATGNKSLLPGKTQNL